MKVFEDMMNFGWIWRSGRRKKMKRGKKLCGDGSVLYIMDQQSNGWNHIRDVIH